MCNISISYNHWYGDHSGGATPGPISNPEVKSSSDLDCTIGAGLWELQDVAGHHSHFYFRFTTLLVITPQHSESYVADTPT